MCLTGKIYGWNNHILLIFCRRNSVHLDMFPVVRMMTVSCPYILKVCTGFALSQRWIFLISCRFYLLKEWISSGASEPSSRTESPVFFCRGSRSRSHSPTGRNSDVNRKRAREPSTTQPPLSPQESPQKQQSMFRETILKCIKFL